MNYEQATLALNSGTIVRRKAWPKTTALVIQGGYEADLSKWSDRSPLSRAALAFFGFTEKFKINAHIDMISTSGLTCGYVMTREDVVAEDWEKVEIPVAEPAAGTADGPQNLGQQKQPAPTGGDINAGAKQKQTLSEPNGNFDQQPTDQIKADGFATSEQPQLNKTEQQGISDNPAVSQIKEPQTGNENNTETGPFGN